MKKGAKLINYLLKQSLSQFNYTEFKDLFSIDISLKNDG